jgi:hypothetical protein
VRATWAPKGRTPVLRHRFNWTRLSMSGALAYKPDRTEAALVFQIKEGSYNTESLIDFLTDLHTHFEERITLIWDGLPSHRSRRMKTWIATLTRWFSTRTLTPFAVYCLDAGGLCIVRFA